MVQPEIILDPSIKDKDPRISAAWLTYVGERVYWVMKKFKEEHPESREYQYTFDEEVVARKSMMLIWQGSRERGKIQDEYLDELLKVYEAGFLNEYVWTFLWQPNWTQDPALRLGEFETWKKAHLHQHAAKTLAWYLKPKP